jgi:UDP-N-acetylmuramoylalanine--D-glutamate ligase
LSKKLIILGAGESGVGAAILGKLKGYAVFLSDAGKLRASYRNTLIEHQINFEEEGHTLDRILTADEIIKSPGIPETAQVMQLVRGKNIEVISEIEFAFRYVGNSTVIAITGTNGKSTTTHLTHHIFKQANTSCALVGNIGNSFALQVALDPKDYYICEVSSFQLDDCKTFKPHIAILTNITPDHLDRYNYEIKKYVASKFSITKNQTSSDYFIYNADDEITQQFITEYPFNSNPLNFSMYKKLTKGAYVQSGELVFNTGKDAGEYSIHDYVLRGRHNQYNLMGACLSAMMVEIRKETIRDAVADYRGLEHRLETVATIKGVEFINDSKSTNINGTWWALESMTKPTVLILGGVDKGNDYDEINDLVKQKVKAIVCLGTNNSKIKNYFKDFVTTIVETESMHDCVQQAFKLSAKGDAVLLSPTCASFDLFENFEDRGNQFKKQVIEL